MINIRRALLLVGLSTAVALGTVGPAAPADASLADSATVSTAISTTTVAPVTNLVGNLVCTAPTSTMSATWTRATTPRISGYTVKVYFSDGFVQSVELPATASSWSAPIDKYFVTAFSVQYSVTTKTDYGWTKESAKTGSFQC